MVDRLCNFNTDSPEPKADPSPFFFWDTVTEEERICIEITREIFGNPFRPVDLDPRWLTSTVVDLASTIYDERVFKRMPILGDALMDAGCDREEILHHCLGDEPHARGCWVVDLLLSKDR